MTKITKKQQLWAKMQDAYYQQIVVELTDVCSLSYARKICKEAWPNSEVKIHSDDSGVFWCSYC